MPRRRILRQQPREVRKPGRLARFLRGNLHLDIKWQVRRIKEAHGEIWILIVALTIEGFPGLLDLPRLFCLILCMSIVALGVDPLGDLPPALLRIEEDCRGLVLRGNLHPCTARRSVLAEVEAVHAVRILFGGLPPAHEHCLPRSAAGIERLQRFGQSHGAPPTASILLFNRSVLLAMPLCLHTSACSSGRRSWCCLRRWCCLGVVHRQADLNLHAPWQVRRVNQADVEAGILLVGFAVEDSPVSGDLPRQQGIVLHLCEVAPGLQALRQSPDALGLAVENHRGLLCVCLFVDRTTIMLIVLAQVEPMHAACQAGFRVTTGAEQRLASLCATVEPLQSLWQWQSVPHRTFGRWPRSKSCQCWGLLV
mmetsp:Transcript_51637/g.120007  ORF Transcript_51637/g.120007 Transcript_51637/m.120007 type:complete len:366 (-) Transcript_51637:61-1158(-)